MVSFSLPCFNEPYVLFYPAGVKIVPSTIGELLTDESTIHHFQFLMGQRSLQTPNICMDLQPIKYWK